MDIELAPFSGRLWHFFTEQRRFVGEGTCFAAILGFRTDKGTRGDWFLEESGHTPLMGEAGEAFRLRGATPGSAAAIGHDFHESGPRVVSVYRVSSKLNRPSSRSACYCELSERKRTRARTAAIFGPLRPDRFRGFPETPLIFPAPTSVLLLIEFCEGFLPGISNSEATSVEKSAFGKSAAALVTFSLPNDCLRPPDRIDYSVFFPANYEITLAEI